MADADDPAVIHTDPRPVVPVAVAADGAGADALAAGQAVGRYRIVRLIGSGGVGEVYLAADEQLQRDVAIKVVRPGALGSDHTHVARDQLVQEAQGMARVAHPNIVVVHEAGLVDDQVFIAMEYVAGTTLRGWAEAEPRAWRDVVRMYIAAGRGLAALHAAGLVHRDVKPDNILVGADGRPRLGDFGLAAPGGDAPSPAAGTVSPYAITHDDRGGAVATYSRVHGGTPRYMAPEQHTGGRVDARSDQFAFCVSLWEALTGQAPFPATDYPALRAQALAGVPIETAGARPIPGWIRAALVRGLARDPDARWPSMDALLDRLGRDPRTQRNRVIAGVAVLGLAGVAVYGLTRDGAAAPAGPPPCGGMEHLLDGAWDPTVQAAITTAFAATGRHHSDEAAERVATGLTAYADGWRAMRKDTCLATAVRRDQSEAMRDVRMACLDRRAGELRALTGVLATAADTGTVDRAVAAVNDLRPVASCADATSLAEIPAPTAEQAPKVAALRARVDTARARFRAGQYKAALPDAVAVAAEAHELGYAPLEADALTALGALESLLKQQPDAERDFRAALDLAALAHDDTVIAASWLGLVDAANGLAHYDEALERFRAGTAALARAGNPPVELARLLLSGSTVEIKQGDYAAAVDLTGRALELYRQAGNADLDRAGALNARGVALRYMVRDAESLAAFTEAFTIWERVLGPNHPNIAGVLMNMAGEETGLRKLDLALEHTQRSLALTEEVFGPDALNTAKVLNSLCHVYIGLARMDDAKAACERALAIKIAVGGPDSPEQVSTLHNLGDIAEAGADWAAARKYRTRLVEIQTKAAGPDSVAVAEPLIALGDVESADGHYPAAERLYRRALALWTAAGNGKIPDAEYSLTMVQLAAKHLDAALATATQELADRLMMRPDDARGLSIDHLTLGRVLLARGELAGAEAEIEQSLAFTEATEAADDPDLCEPLSVLGDIRLADHRPADAIAPLERAVQIFGDGGASKVGLASVQFTLAEALWASGGDRARARELAQSAATGFAALPVSGEVTAMRKQIAAWLAAHHA